ncbi:MAG: XdhC family protein, partial [Gemmatimonadales bacterium]
LESGQSYGGVSGGCLEADVREIARASWDDDVPRLCHYDTGDDPGTVWGLGLGCNGSVDVFVQPATPRSSDDWSRVGNLLAGDRRFAVATVIAESPEGGRCLIHTGEGISGTTGDEQVDEYLAGIAGDCVATGRSVYRAIGLVPVFCEVYEPPPRLVIFGAGDDAIPLSAMGTTVGFRVSVVDHRPAFINKDRFPDALSLIDRRPDDGLDGLLLHADSYAVVMTHALDHDAAWLRQLLDSEVGYIGVLGPQPRTDRILAEIGWESDQRIYGPVGLDIAADGPEQIALSILSELLAVRGGREAAHLRNRAGSIHSVQT